MSIEFLITALIVVIAPGTGVVYTLAIGLSRGRRASVAAAFGCTLGIVPAMAAAVLGLAAILHTSALLFQALKIIGVAYLLYLAWMTLQDDGPLALGDTATEKTEKRTPTPLWRVARTGMLINVLNPKLSLFFMAFLPQFVDAQAADATARMLFLGGVFMAMTFAVFVVYGMFAAAIGAQLSRRPAILTWLRRAIAASFAGFGVRLALAER